MHYQTFEPSATLNAFVKCYWTLDAPREVSAQKQRIVPDGCMEMIFNYGDPYKQYLENGNSILQPACFVIGQLTLPLDIEPTGITGIFSVRFHPGGFMPFTAIPVKDLENKAVPLQELFDADGLTIATTIQQAATTQERISYVEHFLAGRLTKKETIDRIVKTTVDMMLGINGQLSVTELAQQLSVNRRQLERKFASVIGLSPKQLFKIIRLQAALKLLINKKPASLTALAYEGAYYDQAHFIKDFREFTGVTPKKFYHKHLELSSLFYGTG